ncbi:cyclic nucleotide-regulated FAD-dependent pyridine nucleotide-disulphide oxidoreductase [Chthoniobacter flavus Ellin428]|uniref:Cyclic nucleotide-regulated FAD-dependent pyridine nucleotide-disulphide oxidoreductase n=1 Tax=Chthoniobacter flavus Ellin428 TaxID=497964 RepID=B4D412_9BACT|nr:FAD-dependent oxidoreductase [Chthoniobacter flavus]EDY18992.1 cyclic nucleotide-regulated FAD-dependent pyridine nucleotide-disulphide oxidoreductase [Chthoniobacter flavus Ellin428]TCO93573.1 thioredoxin reductase (NADPH) [Chthoniobacter flavus]
MNTPDPDEQFYRDTESVAFPKLDDRQMAMLEGLGRRRKVKQGEIIYRAGQRDFAMAVVITGEIEVFAVRDGVEQILAGGGPRDFAGDIAMLNGTSAVASARGKSPESEILEVPAADLRRALVELPGLGRPLVDAFIMRRQRLRRDRDFAGLRVLADGGSQDGHLIHDFLDKNHIPHRLIPVESEDGKALAARLHLAHRDLPALIDVNGAPLRRPSLREVAQVAGLLRRLEREDEMEIFCDLVIVGAGPAGLAAAVYAASEGLKTVVLESYAPGGQAGSSSLIENFFGFPTGISGGDLTHRAQLQAFRFGAKFSTPAQALSLTITDGEYRAALQVESCPATLWARCAIIATGASYRRIEAEGREDFEGLGVYYAATAMEGALCRGATVVVAGGGNSAGQAAMFLSECAAKVLLVIRGADLSKSMSSYLSRRVETKENIEILRYTEIRKMTGGRCLEQVELENTATGERRTVQTPAVFSMIGAKPCTDWLPPEIEVDEKGFIKTGQAVAKAPAWQKSERPPGALETSCPGIFAAGDVRSGSVKRCAAAVGEGGTAVEGVHDALGTYVERIAPPRG